MYLYFIIGIGLGALLIGIPSLLIKREAEKKYGDMKEHYEKRVSDETRDNAYWHDKCLNMSYKNCVTDGRVDAYEKIVNKLLCNKSENTDELFMFEGKFYRATDFTLNRDVDGVDTLYVEFEKARG